MLMLNTTRLKERYKRIIEPNIEHIKNKVVLDLGCYNGRWSYAAIKNGAKFVIGVDARNNILLTDDKFRFIQSDVFDIHIQHGVDTIFCLGLFYHIMDHFRLFKLMDSFNPEVIILDTHLENTDDCIISVRKEDTEYELNSITELSGKISKGTLKLFAEYFGYDLEYMEWKPPIVKYTEDYYDDRYTIRMRKYA